MSRFSVLSNQLRDVIRQQEVGAQQVACTVRGHHGLPILWHSHVFCTVVPQQRLSTVQNLIIQSLCQPGLRQGLCPTAVHATNVLLLVLADPTVLLRLLDLLELFCTRLQRSNGLVFEGYTPAAGKAPWTPAPDTTINYGTV